MGQFAIACRPHNDRLWDMLAAYGNEMHIFLMILNITGLILYFITSSDSGSNPKPQPQTSTLSRLQDRDKTS